MARLAIIVDPSGAVSGARKVERSLDSVAAKATKTQLAMRAVGNTTERAMTKAAVATKAFGATLMTARLSAAAIGAALVGALSKGVSAAIGLDRALGEASTLIQGTAAEMAMMREEASRMAVQFGSSSTAQVQAYYQAISAGASSVAEATAMLETANLLALGGVTDITTAVDVLTTAVNAYAGSGLTAAAASDMLFAGVKAGKTTVNELAGGLGNVAPIAAQLGLGLEQVVAATAALTKGGIKTSVAFTNVKAILSGVLKPTSEAAKLSAALGLEFNSAALKAKGLSGFLKDVMEKTEGNQDAFAMLFGSVEALGGVMALTANNGAELEKILGDVTNSAGATQTAADKLAEGLSQRLAVQGKAVAELLTKIGTIILTIAVPALEFMTENAGKVGAALLIAFGGPVGIGIVAVGLAIKGVVAYADSLASAQSDLDTATANAVIGMSDEIIQSQLLSAAISKSSVMSENAAAIKLEEAKARNVNVVAIIAERRALALTSDEYLDSRKKVKDLQTALSALPTGAFGKDSREAMEGLIAKAQVGSLAILEVDATMAAQLARTKVNISELETAIANAVDGVVVLGKEFITPAEASERLKKALAGVRIVGVGAGGAVKKAFDPLKDLFASLDRLVNDLANSMAQSIGDGFTDMVSGTKTVAEAFRSMAYEIIKKLYEVIVVQKIVGSFGVKGTANSGLAGLLGGLITGPNFTKVAANGDAFSGGNVIPFASGGVVSSPTVFPMANGGVGLMGEAGPEAIMPLSRGANGKLGVKSSGGGGTVTINNTFTGGVTQADLGAILPKVVEASKRAVLDARKRGGSYAAGFGG